MQADFGTMEKCQNADLTLNSSLITEYHKIPKNEPRGLWLPKDYFRGVYSKGLIMGFLAFRIWEIYLQRGLFYREAYFLNK